MSASRRNGTCGAPGVCPSLVESRCGAAALGRTYLLPPLSSGGASVVRPWLRFHTPLIGRVEDWRVGLGRCSCSLLSRPFVCECHSISTMPRFQSPPRRTQRADFPLYALLFASPQGLWDLSCRAHCLIENVTEDPAPMTGVASPNRAGGADGETDQHGRAARGGVGGGGALPGGGTAREGAHPGRADGDDGVASQARCQCV